MGPAALMTCFIAEVTAGVPPAYDLGVLTLGACSDFGCWSFMSVALNCKLFARELAARLATCHHADVIKVAPKSVCVQSVKLRRYPVWWA